MNESIIQSIVKHRNLLSVCVLNLLQVVDPVYLWKRGLFWIQWFRESLDLWPLNIMLLSAECNYYWFWSWSQSACSYTVGVIPLHIINELLMTIDGQRICLSHTKCLWNRQASEIRSLHSWGGHDSPRSESGVDQQHEELWFIPVFLCLSRSSL